MKKRITSLLICVCMALTIFTPLINVSANDGGVSSSGLNTFKTANGLELSKSATPNANGDGYKLTLEAYTTGDVITEQVSVPTDIVLVLDQSGSMSETFSGGTTRQQAMKNAVQKLIDSVSQNAKDNKVNHRISVVTFGDNATEKRGLTELYSSTNPNQNTTGKNALKNTINDLPSSPSGATRVDLGMNKAQTILNKSTSTGDRNKIVVLFTDGIPTSSNKFDIAVANKAITTAKQMKDAGVEVYTIGVFSYADKNQLFGKKNDAAKSSDVVCNGNVGSYWEKRTANNSYDGVSIPAANRFLNYLSSNFEEALSLGLDRTSGVDEVWKPTWWIFGEYVYYYWERYTITANFNRTSDKYYQTANNVAELESVFETIAKTVENPKINLDASTQIKDFISDSFALSQSPTAIKTYTQNYNGNNLWADKVENSSVTVTTSGKEVTVSGYDFNSNFVSNAQKADGTRGQKLVIEIDIVPQTFGGNAIKTNGFASGVYKGGELIANFSSPEVDVAINHNLKVASQTIYVGSNASLDDMIKKGTADFVEPNGKNNAYVDIKYTIKQGSVVIGTYTIAAGADTGVWDNSISTISNLTSTTDYTINCTVTPTTAGTVAAKSTDLSAKVYVLTPKISFANQTLNTNYGSDINLNDNVVDGWVTITDAPTPKSLEPAISYEITDKDTNQEITNPANYNAIKDSTMKVTKVMVGDKNVTANTTFDPTSAEFKVKLNRFDLTISKTIDDEIDQTFILNVGSTLTGQKLKVTMTPEDFANGTATKKIKGLYCGVSYDISIDNSWSWRYTNGTIATAFATATETEKLVDISSTRPNGKWLTGQSSASMIVEN